MCPRPSQKAPLQLDASNCRIGCLCFCQSVICIPPFFNPPPLPSVVPLFIGVFVRRILHRNFCKSLLISYQIFLLLLILVAEFINLVEKWARRRQQLVNDEEDNASDEWQQQECDEDGEQQSGEKVRELPEFLAFPGRGSNSAINLSNAPFFSEICCEFPSSSLCSLPPFSAPPFWSFSFSCMDDVHNWALAIGRAKMATENIIYI